MCKVVEKGNFMILPLSPTVKSSQQVMMKRELKQNLSAYDKPQMWFWNNSLWKPDKGRIEKSNLCQLQFININFFFVSRNKVL